MKTFMTTTAIALFIASTAAAQDFKATEYRSTFASGALQFSLGTVEGELETIATGATVANYSIGALENFVYTELEYNRAVSTLALTLEYGVFAELDSRFAAYGTAAVSYITPTASLGSGDFYVAPTLGVSYAALDNLSIFGDVTYTWNASNSWAREGGAVEVGVAYSLTDNFSVIPSLVRTFDTGANTTNVKIETVFRF
jgi:opacity protein-like surface antigen